MYRVEQFYQHFYFIRIRNMTILRKVDYVTIIFILLTCTNYLVTKSEI